MSSPLLFNSTLSKLRRSTVSVFKDSANPTFSGSSPSASASFLALSSLSFSSLAFTIAETGLSTFDSSFFSSFAETLFVFDLLPPKNEELVEDDLSLSMSDPKDTPLPLKAENALLDSSYGCYYLDPFGAWVAV
jgi:hypothetical protein